MCVSFLPLIFSLDNKPGVNSRNTTNFNRNRKKGNVRNIFLAMDSAESRTYDIKVTDDEPSKIVNTSVINNNNNDNDNGVNSDRNEATPSIDSLLQAQLCNSCRKEKATIICTLCFSDSSSPYFCDNIPTVKHSSNLTQVNDIESPKESDVCGDGDDLLTAANKNIEQLIKSKKNAPQYFKTKYFVLKKLIFFQY